jgi:hypothetical protein
MNENIARVGVLLEALGGKSKKEEGGGSGSLEFSGTPGGLSEMLSTLRYQTQVIESESGWRLVRNNEVIKLGDFEVGGLKGCGVEMDTKTMELLIDSLR